MMKGRIQGLGVLWLLWLLVSACYPREQRLGAAFLSLRFSVDSLSFDTLLAGVRSGAQRLRLHNPNRHAVEVETLWVADGSPFSFWFDGKQQQRVGPFRILGKDSVLLYVEANVARGGARAEPVHRRERLHVRIGGEQQLALPLIVWEQDGERFEERVSITSDTRWEGLPARHILKELHVARGAVLEIGAGMYCYFAPNTRFHIEGRLLVKGTADAPVVFAAERQDGRYDKTPGQWEGLVFAPSNEESALEHVRIRNARIGLLLGEPQARDGAQLQLGHAIIAYCSEAALRAYGGQTMVYNTLMHNSGGYLVAHHGGGTHRYVHATLSNDQSALLEGGGALFASDHLPEQSETSLPLSLRIQNSVLWGSYSEVFTFEASSAIVPEIEYTVVRSASGMHLATGNNHWSTEPNYVGFLDPSKEDYRPSETSVARDAGRRLSDALQQEDLRGATRDNKPDIGAYEWLPPKLIPPSISQKATKTSMGYFLSLNMTHQNPLSYESFSFFNISALCLVDAYPGSTTYGNIFDASLPRGNH